MWRWKLRMAECGRRWSQCSVFMASSRTLTVWCCVLAAARLAQGGWCGGVFNILWKNRNCAAGGGGVQTSGGNVGVGSPCPAVFRYEWDGAEWYGIITAPSLPYGTPARLIARLSIGRVLPSKYAGSIELIGPRADVLHAMLTEQPIRYQVNFPLPHPLPVVTAITLNDRLICSGPVVSSPVVTSITLEHNLYPHGQGLNARGQPLSPQNPPVLQPQFPTRESEVLVEQQQPEETSEVFIGNVDIGQPNIPEDNKENNPRGDAVFEQGPSTSVQNVIERDVYKDICGMPVTVRPLVANGEIVRRGSHPWLVALFAQKSLGVEFICGGTLVSTKYVITAAHCIRYGENRALTAEELVIVLGKYRIRRWTEPGSVVRDATRITLHPDYRALSGDADLAAIELSEPIQFSDTIRPVCFWSPSDEADLVGEQATIVGWGRDETGQKVTPEPRQTKVKIVSQEDCLRSRLEFRYITSNRTICAGGVQKGSGPCSGDSGGGLFMQGNDRRWYLRGVISMSLADPTTKSCDLESYSVFVNIAKFNDWLVQFIR